jgi:capsular exopolysaccharide synthesis family protein
VRPVFTVTEPVSPAELSPSDYLRPIWRFKWILVPLVALIVVATYKVTDRQHRVYEATAVVYVGASDLDQLLAGGGGNLPSDLRSIANQSRLIQSAPVAAKVAQTLGIRVSPDALAGAVAVATDPNSDFITVKARAGNPVFTARLANTFVLSYLDIRRANQLRAARDALRTSQERYAGLPARQRNSLQGASLQDRISSLQNSLLAPPSVGQLSVRAQPAGAPISPKPKRNAIFGGIFALLIGIIFAFVFDRNDRRLRKPEDVESAYGAPVLAMVPRTKHTSAMLDGRPVISKELREPLRSLRVNVALSAHDRAPRTVLVTSAVPEEGKSTIVRNLALSYLEADIRVVVVEADLRKPTLSKSFGLEAGRGLTDVLIGEASIPEVLTQIDDDERVTVMCAGTPLHDPTAVLTAARMRPLLDQLLAEFDVVLIDSPPVLAVSDALQLLEVADATILVAREGTATGDLARRLRHTLDRLPGRPPLGVVLNGAKSVEAGYGGYEYGDRAPAKKREDRVVERTNAA